MRRMVSNYRDQLVKNASINLKSSERYDRTSFSVSNINGHSVNFKTRASGCTMQDRIFQTNRCYHHYRNIVEVERLQF